MRQPRHPGSGLGKTGHLDPDAGPLFPGAFDVMTSFYCTQHQIRWNTSKCSKFKEE